LVGELDPHCAVCGLGENQVRDTARVAQVACARLDARQVLASIGDTRELLESLGYTAAEIAGLTPPA